VKKTTKRKLALAHEIVKTLIELPDARLQEVHGGRRGISGSATDCSGPGCTDVEHGCQISLK